MKKKIKQVDMTDYYDEVERKPVPEKKQESDKQTQFVEE